MKWVFFAILPSLPLNPSCEFSFPETEIADIY